MQITQTKPTEADKTTGRAFQLFKRFVGNSAREITLLIGWLGSCLISLNLTKSTTTLAPTYLDADWIVSLPYFLQKGSLFGRDSLFTYGPVTEILHWFFILPVPNQNALNGYYLGILGEFCFSLFCFSLILWLLKSLSWRFIAFIFLASALLGASLIGANYRNLLLLLSVILLAHAMNASNRKWQILGAILVGLFDVLLEGVTFELALYALTVTSVLLIIYSIAARFKLLKGVNLQSSQAYLQILGILLGTYLIGNLLVSLLFLITSPDYPSLFYYQITSLQIAVGYNYTLVGAWELSWTATLLLGLIVLFCIVVILKALPRLSALDNYLFLGLLGTSLISLKSITVRSGLGHILTGSAPVLILFLVLGGVSWVRDSDWFKLAWIGLLIAFVLTWPGSSLENLKTLAQIPEGKFSITNSWRAVKNYQLPTEKATPSTVLNALDPSKDLSIFPYNNHIAIEANRKLLAPVLQTYAATNITTQNSYIQVLDKHKSNLEVLYALDGLTSGPLDNVQFVTRAPVVFEYLYRNFKSVNPDLYSKGYMLLRPSQTDITSEMQAVPLDFKTIIQDQTRTYRLYKATDCSLVRITPKISYPIFSVLGRPAAFNLTFWSGNQVVIKADMVTLDPGKAFSTYVSLTDWPKFANVFDNQPVQTKKLDAFQVVTKPSGLFQVNPSSFELTKFECITFKH